jgi:translation initiation factor 2 beta subunit (eIF-2beta)/eIF-5
MSISKDLSNKCICGGVMIYKRGVIKKVIREKIVNLYNTPFSECTQCQEIEYNLQDNISTYIVMAYKQGVENTIYNSFIAKN